MLRLAAFARFLSALSLALLPAFLFPYAALADEGLRADKRELAVGESTTLRLDGVSGWFKTRWHDSPDGVIRFDDTSNSEARITALKPGRVSITAKVLTSSYSLDLKVLDAPGKPDIKGDWQTKIEGMAKVRGFPDARARIVRMLAEVNSGSRTPQAFYADLAKLPATMFDVIAVRSKLVDGDPAFARDVLGATYTAGGTPVEKSLLTWRREQTLAAIDDVVRRFVVAGRVPADGYSLIISHVGKWANTDQDAPNFDALTFAGDIDFSFVSNDEALTLAMKEAFAEIIKQRTGLDPIALDAVATAHGKAGLEVYIGAHGMGFAEGQMKNNELVDMRTGARMKRSLEEVAMGLTMERAMSEVFGKEPPWPAHNDEPGLSMEMLRHFDHDIVKAGIYDMANAVVKAAKYLDRSYKSLKTSGGQPGDAALAKFAGDLTEWANTTPQTVEIRERMVKRISDYLAAKPKVVFDQNTRKLVLSLDAGRIAAFHKKAAEAMWKTVEQGSNSRTHELETRMREISERNRRGEIDKDGVEAEVAKLRKEMVELVDMVEAEMKAFQGVEVPKVVIDNNTRMRGLLNILSGRFGTRVLSADELKDKKFVEELLKAEAERGSNTRREMTAAYIMERSLDTLMKSPEIAMSGVEKGNQMLDYIDDGLLGSLRGETGFNDFETEMKWIRAAAADPKTKPGALKRLNVLKGTVALGIKASNQKINAALQATAAGRQGMKFMMVYGLVDEMKSYRDAFNNDGWGGFATEIFRRRIPLGSALEGAMMGNTYRAGWDVITTLIPPLALPEAAWGLGTAIGTQARATYWNEQLALFVDTLYDSATFKLEQVETHGGAKVGVYRLVAVKHRGITIDLSQFAAMRREQVDALRQQIGKSRLDWAAYSKEFQGLTRWTEVDTLLQKNIADSDPGLALIEEMMKHPNVGPKLMDRLAEKGLVRWEEVKLGFITNLIKRLEDRKQADQALGAGMLPDLFQELRKAAAALEIENAMLRALDAEVDTNNLKALMNWLWEAKRDVQGQAPTESETTRAAQVVKRYLDTYKGIVKSRDDLLAALPTSARKDGATRYLTTDLFLSGRADADQAAADAWVKHVGVSVSAGNEALLAIKKEFLPNVALDDEDSPYLKRLFPRELWMKPYTEASKARGNVLSLLDRAIDHGKARNAILDEYRAWLEKQAPVQLTVTVLDARDGKRQVNGATGDLRPTDALGKPGSGKVSGNQLLFGVPTGNYRLTIKAPGYEDANKDVLLGRNLNPTPKLSISLTPSGDEAKNAAPSSKEVATALQARDWKRLIALLEAEKKSDLKQRDTATWQANIDAINGALQTLKDERMKWLLGWEGYVRAVEKADNRAYDQLKQEVAQQLAKFENQCFRNGADPEHLRGDRCRKEGYVYEENCLPKSLRLAHSDEQLRISTSRNLLPNEVQLMHSTGFTSYQAFFDKLEALNKQHGLPFPYPDPVVERLKYQSQCAKLADVKAGKNQDDLADFKVSLKAPTAAVPLGKPVTLSASAGGGKGPYRYDWSGASGNGTRATLLPTWAGDWTVSVTVRDAEGKGGTASATIMVSPMKIRLAGAKGQVFYGSEAKLSTEGLELGKPAPATTSAPAADPCASPGNPFCVDTTHSGTINYTGGKGYSPPVDDGQHQYVPNPSQEFIKPPVEIGYRIVWQAEPGLTFNPPTSDNGVTKVSYDRMGQVKLWCEALKWVNGAYQTVGECEQVTITVVAPKLSVSFTPGDGQARIGQEVRARITTQPNVPAKLINYRWLEPGTANRMEYGDNAGEIGFKVKDASTMVLKALARVPHHGDDLGTVDATYTGAAYEVKAWLVEPGNRPMMWDAKKGGLIPVPKGAYATHERIGLRAEIVGGTSEVVRWNWRVNEGTSISNPISQTPTVTRSSPGEIGAQVEARNAEGALLGSADVSASVIETTDRAPVAATPNVTLKPEKDAPERGERVWIEAEVSGGKAPYRYTWKGALGGGARVQATSSKTGNHVVSVSVRDSKGKTGTASVSLNVQPNQADRAQEEANRLGEQAREQLRRGDLPAAIQSARESQKLDPTSARKIAREVADSAKKAGWNSVNQRDFAQAVPNLEVAHELDPTDKDATDKLNKAQRFAQVWPRVEAKAREFNTQMADKKVWSAQKTLLQMQDLQHDMTGGMSNPLSKQAMDDFNAGMAEYSRFMREVESNNTRAFKEKNWQAMLENAETALRREHDPANEKQLKSHIDLARQMLREQAAKPVQSVEGTWAINGNGYRGKLEISRQGGQLSGRVWYDSHGKWETLHDVRFDGRTITFIRPIRNLDQGYTGTLSGNEFKGNFTQQGGSRVYPWSARMQAAASPDAPSVAASAGTGGASLSLDRTRFEPGAAITVRFTAPASWPSNAWVGIIPSRIAHGEEKENDRYDVSYQYLKKRASGTLTFTAPAAGDWDFRMHDTDSNGKEMASISFSVGAAGEPAPKAAAKPTTNLTGETNLARGKPASQSSRSQWSRPDDPQRAVDGVINGGYGFHTNKEVNPWWQVDLGAPYRVTEVRIYNRLDSGKERARTVQLMLSDDGHSWRTVYRHDGSLFGGKDGKPLIVDLNGDPARHVRLQLNETTWFHLDEVEVLGSDAGRDYSGYSPQPASSAPPTEAANLLEQVDAIKNTWKGLKGLFGN
ncbi:MAG: discoidin domain-containing protein [Gallionellaceae bacterium]|nr:discoidin domain-containing protein [Gallionellaceae bacterium]